MKVNTLNMESVCSDQNPKVTFVLKFTTTLNQKICQLVISIDGCVPAMSIMVMNRPAAACTIVI
jgi:hypothetical protein